MIGIWLLPHFQRPAWLWALLALPLLWLAWRRGRASGWRDAVDAHLLPYLIEPGGGRAGLRLAGVWLAFALGVLALSGPGWRQEAQPRWQSHAPLVVALDLSASMTTPDLPPSRLAQARAKLAQLLRERRGGEVGLVAWAEDAYTVAPLTTDAANLALFLDALAPEVMPVDGRRPERALTHAASLLRQAGFERGTIVLMTAQADAASVDIAAALAARGHTVSVLGLGTAAGALYRDRGGAMRESRLEAASLSALASAGRGRYAALTVDDADLRTLGVLEPGAAQAREGDAGERVWLDQGYWLLLPLLLLAALAFRRGAGVLAALPLALLLAMPMPARADGGWWRRADQHAQQALEQGVDAYRHGEFAAAERAFATAGARGAEAEYNLGNALARQGRYDEAIAAYDRALAQAPEMEDAIANRRVVDAARQPHPPSGQGGRPPPEGTQGQGGDDGQGTPDGRGSPPPAQPPPSQGDPGEREPGHPDGAPSPQEREGPAPQAEDADARQRQEQADHEQRQRMQEALERGDPAEQPATAQADAEDAQERERRQAHEAWLRRVPDDPGGLLRAKFRLEHERRQREGR
ncbi:hypothetical protein B1992_07870 [Pseudoxanthomonas broegbernensis]|uniref:VWFA domain-containing protein n=1 Tax=Pseudoxanthomonas broegbernensis TaxID=83619 RepID=A0A7V8GMD7_9GAMM|nr:VWA domain-containing protein [Pseudoxanthomonas broegbernensis]KAF1686459.1 hypothetical protein B1992_07870 [Pseudoxanthomonas broegbernensis]MBB6064286.1 Ca-activated chloride channel family protein [Pseudoxanthomonas broegbernensis]